jgi:NADH-quinone oxidoreductase subunit N
MIVGNVVAIRQTNIKRLLAYSSIAQAGYILLGVVAATPTGVASISFYIFAYLFANMGAFAVITIFSDRTGSEQIADYAGFAKSSPVLAAALSVFLLSLAGIPPLAGFLAKYYVFAAAVQAGYTWLVILAVLTTVIALYYYANVIRLMYLTPDTNPHHIIPSFPAGLVLVLSVAGVVVFGILPQKILELAMAAASSFAF